MKILKKIEIIKILICIIVISFVGCGGGGGGSNVSVRPTTSNMPNVIVPNVTDKNSGYTIECKIDSDNILNQNLSVKGDRIVGVYGNKINFSGNLEIEDTKVASIYKTKDLSSFSFGLFSENGQIKNNGKVNLYGDKIIGIFGNDSDITNNGEINSKISNETIGIFATGDKSIVRNNGSVILFGKNKSIGLYINNSVGINNNSISVSSNDVSIGMIALGKSGTIINNDKIFINSQNKGYGMISGYGAKAINNGIININNKGYGMVAYNGGYALNDLGGIINLSSKSDGAMLAYGNGSIIENKGTINIDKNNSIIKNGEELKAINGGKIINTGIIKKDNNLYLDSRSGIYSIGTEINGKYGKVRSDSLNINGNIEIDTNITKEGYKDKYLLKDVFVAKEIKLGEKISVKSNSLLYDAKLESNNEEYIDGILIRNSKELTDFVGETLKETARIFNECYNEDKYILLDKHTKNILNKIDLSNKFSLEKNLLELTPSIYANRRNQILELHNLLEENRINSVDKQNNFNIIEKYNKSKSRGIIEGYNHLISGFFYTGQVLGDNFLSLGYINSDIDYDKNSSGKIDGLFLGIDKIIKLEDKKLKFGGSGEYNFHKNKRNFSDIEFSSKYRSYGITSYGEFSKEYNEKINIEPFSRINLGYYKIQSFNENIENFIISVEKDDFILIDPQIGIRLNKKIDNINFKSNLNYSYKINQDNSKISYRYENLNKNSSLEEKNLNKETLDINFGLEYSTNIIDLNITFGKELINKNNNYITTNFIYKF